MTIILLVDDSDDLRALYGGMLRRHGYEVQEAENGQVALERLQHMRGSPCLVLLDLMMPIMSGPEFLKVLHESGRLATLPVIALSAGGQASDAPEAAKFVRKPVTAEVLIALVREFCGHAPE